jgi:hypothetical protein
MLPKLPRKGRGGGAVQLCGAFHSAGQDGRISNYFFLLLLAREKHKGGCVVRKLSL